MTWWKVRGFWISSFLFTQFLSLSAHWILRYSRQGFLILILWFSLCSLFCDHSRLHSHSHSHSHYHSVSYLLLWWDQRSSRFQDLFLSSWFSHDSFSAHYTSPFAVYSLCLPLRFMGHQVTFGLSPDPEPVEVQWLSHNIDTQLEDQMVRMLVDEILIDSDLNFTYVPDSLEREAATLLCRLVLPCALLCCFELSCPNQHNM